MTYIPYEPLIVGDNGCITSFICPTAAKSDTYVEVYNSYRQLPASWDFLLPQNHKLGSNNLAYIEDSNVKDVSYYYALVYNNNQPVGVLYMHRLALNKSHYPDFSNQGTIAKHIYKTIVNRQLGLLVVGNLFYTGFPSYWFNSELISATNFFKAIKQALNKLVSTTQSHAIILKDADELLKQHMGPKAWGFEHMGEDIFMQMHLRPEWLSFADYTAALSKKYAARVRKMLNVRQALKLRQLSIAEIEKYLPDIERLYWEVCSHSSVKMGILNGLYFLNMAKAMGNYFEVWGWFKDEKMVAFSSAVIENGDYEVYYIGYGEENNREYCIYPNVLLHGVERAITLKKKNLKLGRTALEAKAIVGCKPVYLDNYIKLKSKPMQLGLKYMLKAFVTERGTEWKKRNPFKA